VREHRYEVVVPRHALRLRHVSNSGGGRLSHCHVSTGLGGIGCGKHTGSSIYGLRLNIQGTDRQGTFREHSVNIRGTDREHSVNIQGTFKEHSGHIQGTFREHSVNIQGTFKEHSGNIQGTFRES
jgi:hypothetical protein